MDFLVEIMTDHDSLRELKASKIDKVKTIDDPTVVPVLFHEKKQKLQHIST